MIVRSAFRLDLQQCLALDGSYETERVWQLEQRDDEAGTTMILRSVLLPRPVEVPYASAGRDVASRWEQRGCVLVGELDGSVRGYLDMSTHWDQGFGFVHNLVVDRPIRRQGLGTALLREAMRWAHQRSLQRVMFALQSKNHPGIQFCRQMGFVFCGFNDRYFANRDIALYYAMRIP